MKISTVCLKTIGLSLCFWALIACENKNIEWDMRKGINTSAAARRASLNLRGQADTRGVMTYPTYQAVIGLKDDTVASVADRLGIDAPSLARHNSLSIGTRLRKGEILILHTQVSTGNSSLLGQSIDVTTMAEGAIIRAEGLTSAQKAPQGWVVGAQPVTISTDPIRHIVSRGETAYGIARLYNVAPRNLADWNGLDKNLTVREGQILIIPLNNTPTPKKVSKPGKGSQTPVPPLASKPLPIDESLTQASPASPSLTQNRTAASASRLAMPIEGKVIRAYNAKSNLGIDIAAAGGSKVTAAADGVVAAITKDTDQVPILVIRHENNLLTVYARIADLKVAKGDKVTRGQTIAKLRGGSSAYLHFELRQGFDSIDPIPYLQ
ncbi:MAG: LysM repeat protein [Paracoccaceae bacterium]|jgi:LysM repeat protein